jgi:hypothetical protein
MRQTIVVSFLAGSVLAGVLATSASPQAASQGRKISDPEMGIAFTVPEGWKAVKQGGGYLMGSDTLKGFLLILPHEYTSLEAMGAEAAEGLIDEEAGILLYLSAELKKFGGKGLQGEFRGTIQGRDAAAYAVGLLSPKGGGVTVLSAVDSASFTEAYRQYARSIASSLTFGVAAAVGGAGTGGAAGGTDAALMRYFQGKYYSYTGGSTIYGSSGTERQVMLCSNGAFFDSYESSASGQGEWGGATARQGRARWSIRGTKQEGVITVTRPDGSATRVSYRVTGEDGVVLFDGIKFAYAGAPECGN